MWEQIGHIQAKNHDTFSKIFCTLFLDQNTHYLQNKKEMKIHIHNQQNIHVISNIFTMKLHTNHPHHMPTFYEKIYHKNTQT
ncbi:hypothetical protein MtrunA17_Chr1g0172871 [Medicago truncatula]|uniref:Uncharacterized protein n=1 Tax=Medicago truncatula TaxID=3880 RepID=A0A396HKH0_MEDTR|nr:hypothetical protein MtrunA17_Chr6g0487891 [Medicago truncatula]RHN79067.1 hypothetical protein MtrunA17_Chr1g0172871 [Medicago truncatula]